MMDEVVAEKDKRSEKNNKRIAEKDEAIQRLEDSADIATALCETRRAETEKWSKRASASFLDSNPFKDLSPVRRPGNTYKTLSGSARIFLIEGRRHPRRKILASKLLTLEEKIGLNMYRPHSELIESAWKQIKQVKDHQDNAKRPSAGSGIHDSVLN